LAPTATDRLPAVGVGDAETVATVVVVVVVGRCLLRCIRARRDRALCCLVRCTPRDVVDVDALNNNTETMTVRQFVVVRHNAATVVPAVTTG